MTVWEIDIYPAKDQIDRQAQRVAAEANELGVVDQLVVSTSRGYLLEGDLQSADVEKITHELLADAIVENAVFAPVGDPGLQTPTHGDPNAQTLVQVLPKPGVMDPVAQSAQAAIQRMGIDVAAVRTLKKYWLGSLDDGPLQRLCARLLANDSIEQVIVGPLTMNHIELGSPYTFQRVTVPLRELDDARLETLSREGQLYLTRVEMQTIQQHFRDLDRDPTDVELETIAQTWSEHCSHKTLAGRIAYEDDQGKRHFENMLKETIFAATVAIRKELGSDDWCVSVFEDNAGVITFDDEYHLVFKVETHNHPSALEPYGGANTGIGGVIRDPLGTGLGAKPVCNTNVFCFASPDTDPQSLPPGVLHPRRVIRGVVAGVRDYGNRMGIPTVNGAIYFDDRYLGNPLVYCGNVGLLPVDKVKKEPQPGDHIVAIGGRTGRDGIHGATFSSAELTSQSESLSGGAVQIGNAITEKMVSDVLLKARDLGLYHAVTDCGAGGFSSAVGEMGESLGAEVALDAAPLKYEGLTYTEIWISEAQERMILAVPPENWETFRDLCASEGVEAVILGTFVDSGRLKLTYHGNVVADLAMDFLHNGRPPVVRDAVYHPPTVNAVPREKLQAPNGDWTKTVCDILGSLNVASKEWVIRQYDHEVQGGSVIKPLVGIANDGPGDAAVVRPRLDSYRGLVVSCGMNPHYGDGDTYHMAASAIDEAIRNAVAVGADPAKIAILDNFCWGHTDRPETLGSLVRASLACHDIAIAMQTPFISGKDSLNNEFSFTNNQNEKQTIAIPPTLLISALGQVADVRKCVTMDLKSAGNRIVLIGATHNELGGSHFGIVQKAPGGNVPVVRPKTARNIFTAVHAAMESGCVRACHDLSEGGLAVAAAEMAFAGGLGIQINLNQVPHTMQGMTHPDTRLLFSESNSRFLCEIANESFDAFVGLMAQGTHAEVPYAEIGIVTNSGQVEMIGCDGQKQVDADIQRLKHAWKAPLQWR